MYLPDHFNQSDPAEIAAFVAAHPFALVVTMVNGEMWPTQIPMFQHGEGTLIGHVARNNIMWQHDPALEVLVVLSGADAYITPNWYETKRLTQRAVTTWNYATVSMWGTMTLHDDARWKRMAVGKLTQIHERGSDHPWKMGDAPQAFLTEQLAHIIGIEISVTRVAAKWKLNQNRIEADRMGVIDGLEQRQREDDAEIARMMRASLSPHDD